MSIMMKAFTATDDAEIKACMEQLLNTDAGLGFIHESFHKDDDAFIHTISAQSFLFPFHAITP